MNKLLHWAVENKSDEKIDRLESMNELDTKWIDVILGKTDSVHINEQFEQIKQSDLQKQREILMDLEEYCWDIDRANAIQDWKFLIKLMEIPKLKDSVYSLFGTILQNNEQAQKKFLGFFEWDKIFQDLELSGDVVKKVIYFLSSVIPHNSQVLDDFLKVKGFERIIKLLHRQSIALSKVAYFINKNEQYTTSLLSPSEKEILKSINSL